VFYLETLKEFFEGVNVKFDLPVKNVAILKYNILMDRTNFMMNK
jgi:hypothetical protein